MPGAGWGRRKEFTVHLDAVSAVDRHVFTADADYELVEVRETHRVAGGSGAAIMLNSAKAGVAPASGTNMLSANLDLTTVADTPVKGSVHGTRSNRQLLRGQQLAIDASGTMTGLVGCAILIVFKRLRAGSFSS